MSILHLQVQLELQVGVAVESSSGFSLYIVDIAYCCTWQLFSHFSISLAYVVFTVYYSRLGFIQLEYTYPVMLLLLFTGVVPRSLGVGW